MPNFTDLAVQRFPPGTYFDARTPAFGIRIGKHRKTWIVTKGANRTKVTIGHYPALGLADARRKAFMIMATPYNPPSAPPFAEALEAFLAQTHWKASTRYTVEKSLRKHFKFTRGLDKITYEDIAQIIDGLPRGAAGEATKNIRAFFNWCVPRYLKESPCLGLKKPHYASRARVLTDDELREVWKAAEAIGGPFGAIVKLLILTGQRRGEIAALKGGWVEEDRITLPAHLTKNGREHILPIGSRTQEVIRPAASGPGLLFPARGLPDTPFKGWSKSKKNLDRISRVDNWTLHDLRRTFSSGLAALGTPLHVTEKLLNHVSGSISGIAAIYNRHTYLAEMRAAIEAWEAKLSALLQR